jgi:hypothetical protein
VGHQLFPSIYVLDHKGVIRYRDVRGEEMDKAVETLLAELRADKGAKQPDPKAPPPKKKPDEKKKG